MCERHLRQLSIPGNIETRFWWPDVLPDINQLGLGKRRWNLFYLATSSAVVEFCLRTIDNIWCLEKKTVHLYTHTQPPLPGSLYIGFTSNTVHLYNPYPTTTTWLSVYRLHFKHSASLYPYPVSHIHLSLHMPNPPVYPFWTHFQLGLWSLSYLFLKIFDTFILAYIFAAL